MSGLDIRAVHRIGSLSLDLALSIGANEILAIVGPNGAGKTTILRIAAGLLPLDDGSVRLDGTVLDDPAADVFVPPEKRPIGIVFQDGLLFAHLTARENIAFGLRARGVAKRDAHARADVLIAQMGLSEHANARPHALSGGQAQRVALARALATNPRVLLLDEPLAALDAGTRIEVRRTFREHLASYDGIRVLVTHDPVEALTLADRVVVLEEGTITQEGTAADLRARPRSPYVAQLLGINLLPGVLEAGQQFRLSNGASLDVASAEAGGRAIAVIEPNAVSLFTTAPEGSARNVWSTTVVELDHEPGRVRVRLGEPIDLVAEVTPAAVDQLALRPGATVWAAVKATAIDVSSA